MTAFLAEHLCLIMLTVIIQDGRQIAAGRYVIRITLQNRLKGIQGILIAADDVKGAGQAEHGFRGVRGVLKGFGLAGDVIVIMVQSILDIFLSAPKFVILQSIQ